jgi:hypothetical protein
VGNKKSGNRKMRSLAPEVAVHDAAVEPREIGDNGQVILEFV